MILIIWDSGKAQECARVIEHALQEPVRVAPSLHEGRELLQSAQYSAVVVDQWITEAEPEPASRFFDHLGMAVPVFVNFGISGVERILRELHVALSRRGLESALARQTALRALRDELKDDVTALLLSCGMALESTKPADPIRERLQQIEALAKHLKTKLETAEKETAVAARA
jgi:hypothetical protein